MASTDPAAVIRRLLEDENIHAQIAEGSAAARSAYRRVRRLPPEKAVQDKDVYDRVRRAASGLMAALRGALGKPAPKPKRGNRLAAAIVVGIGAAVVVWAAKRDAEARAGARAAAAPVAPG